MQQHIQKLRQRRRERRRAREAGFTLTELMVVIFILGLLAAVVLINVMPSRDRAMQEKARADVGALEQALELYRLDLNSYPETEQGLEALVSPPPGLRQPERYREGGYIRSLPEDPWGNPYQYVAPGADGPFDLYSLGADGAVGGEGLDADISGQG
jgi:general secretion pathway protein G